MIKIKIPSITQLKGWLSWEVEQLFIRGLGQLFQLAGLLAVAMVLIVLRPQATELIDQLSVGLIGLLILHPFLCCGEAVVDRTMPRRWFSTPAFPLLFVVAGVLNRWLINLFGMLLFALVLGLAGLPVQFLFSPRYWLLFVLLVPGLVGWGLIVQGLRLIVERGSSIRQGVQRFFELLGGVFFRPAALPFWLFPLHYLIPHAYLNELARDLLETPQHGFFYYFLGVIISLLLFSGGVVIFFRFLDDYIQSGRIFCE